MISIAPVAEEVARLTDAIEAYAERQDLSPLLAHRLAVVVEELAANVAMHGTAGPAPARFVALHLRATDEAIEAVIEDDGAPFDPLAAAPADTEATLDEREIGGLGIHFARKMARTLRYQRVAGRNRVTAIFDP
jgi:serine/threonine-protein kinase RsbW